MNKKIIVTTSWDDGHAIDLRLADLLKKNGLRGTFYISPQSREVSPPNRLRDEDIQTLAQDFEIGAHTMTHPRLSMISDDEARHEIVDSKAYLEHITGQPIKSFCYPGGDFAPQHAAMVRDAGFSLARTVRRFAFDIGSDPYLLPTTIHAYRHWSDLVPIYRYSGPSRFLKQYTSWDELAMSMFDTVRDNGGVFHLWGHSWEIDAHKDWGRLERVCAYISGHDDVTYLTNSALV